MNAYWFRNNGTIDFTAIHSYDTDDFLKDIQVMIAALTKQGLDRVIVVDLTREEIGIPVVRVIVPGLEAFAMDPDRKGRRAIHAQDHRISRAKS
jgi:ribosomal protein S12 methylthiotransferase accessory factor